MLQRTAGDREAGARGCRFREGEGRQRPCREGILLWKTNFDFVGNGRLAAIES